MDLDPASAGHPDAPRYAGFWIRVAANTLDLLLMAAIDMAGVIALEAWASGALGAIGSVSPGVATALVQLGALLPALVIIGFWAVRAATPGKMMLRLRIIDSRTGDAPTLWQCIGRYLMALVSIACAGIGYFWIALDARKQAWHDKVVGTVVIHATR